jgi:predicted ATP-binding protein involved in virulence
MSKITDLHDEIFDYLMQKREAAKRRGIALDFTLRVENKGKKLDKGYWFYGEEKEVIISFWSGYDWLNETPNIYFQISTTGDCSLHFSSGDSPTKGDIFRNLFTGPLDLVIERADQQVKRYRKLDYLEVFDFFLESDKILIDNILTEGRGKLFLEEPGNPVSFIDPYEFESWRKVVHELRRQSNKLTLPYGLLAIGINEFWPIRKLSLEPIPKNSPFIFLTGDNGTGKTTLLKAIAFALGYRYHENKFDPANSLWRVTFRVNTPTKTARYRISYQGVMTDGELPEIPFCCYGATRLDIDDRAMVANPQNYQNRMHPFHSLFSHDGIFKDLNRWLINSLADSDSSARTRYAAIKKMLVDIIPNIYNISEVAWEDSQEILYHEIDSAGERIKEGTSFRNLSSGIKSLIAMLGDMMIRLFEQQPEIEDPSRLQGIVLIDEIDIHLHPGWQRKLPHILHEYFPDVQFIVTTHSPIPLLGAPKNSRIFVIKRIHKQGVVAERLDNQLDLGNMLPNTILTSPIFGMQDIIPESNINLEELSTERSYKQVQANRKIREELKAIAKNIRNEEN